MTASETHAAPLRAPAGLHTPDLRIEQRRTRLSLTPKAGQRVKLTLASEQAVQRAVIEFSMSVERKRPLGLPTDPVEAQAFLSFAKQEALFCIQQCTISGHSKIRQLCELIAQQVTSARLRGSPVQVQVVQEAGQYLPWEWLGVLDRQRSLEDEATSVLGYAGVVFRRDPQREDDAEASLILAAEPLQLHFFRHPGLAATRQEERHFRYSGRFRLIGPAPLAGQPLDLVSSLADPIDPDSQAADQIVHLSCHHGSDDPRTLSAFDLATLDSTMSFGDAPEQCLSIRQLSKELTLAPSHAHTSDRPLVFFNGCGGDFQPFAVHTPAGELLRNGHRAVISTAIRVPDDIAAEFARFYYQRLLQGQISAVALWAARHDLLGLGSPLGLIYSHYGQPALRAAPLPDLTLS